MPQKKIPAPAPATATAPAPTPPAPNKTLKIRLCKHSPPSVGVEDPAEPVLFDIAAYNNEWKDLSTEECWTGFMKDICPHYNAHYVTRRPYIHPEGLCNVKITAGFLKHDSFPFKETFCVHFGEPTANKERPTYPEWARSYRLQ